MEKPGTPLLGVAGGTNPLRVLQPRFTAKNMSQTTPAANQQNTILVYLETNVDLLSGTVIEISGLTGAVASSGGIALDTNVFCSTQSSQAGVGSWNAQTSTMSIRVCDGQEMSALNNLTFSFIITNPPFGQASPAISISARGDGFNISHVAVDKPGTELLG
eukprot:1620174-Rhodomonas_salina.1